tara:strand:+ start:2527 stop:4113 length:1587 start_codon:yes stop_codon:yes gene_type:complete
MGDSAILSVSKNYKKSVGKLTCLNNEIDPNEPFTINNSSDEQVTGSGFFIRVKDLYLPKKMAKNRYLITNAHVVEGASTRRINISFPHLGDTTLWGNVILACRSLDFAIVEVSSENNTHLEKEIGQSFADIFKTIPFVKVSSKPVNTNNELAKSVIAIGYPHDSHDCHISSGKISGKHEHYLQINASINGGNSGGPLFDEDGVCIGICAASFEDSEGITLAVEWHNVNKMLRHYWEQNDETFVIDPPCLGVITTRLIDAYAVTKLKDTTVKGALVTHSFKTSCLKKIKTGDVIMSIGDHKWEYDIDRSGNVTIPFQHDKVKYYSLNVLLLLDPTTCFVRVYTNGKRKTYNFTLSQLEGTVRHVMPALEPIQCISFAGMIITQLTKNHMEEVSEELDPNIINFFTKTHGSEKAIVVSNFHVPCCALQQGYHIKRLTIIKKINRKKVTEIEALRSLLTDLVQKYIENKGGPSAIKTRYIEIETVDEKIILDLQLAFELEVLLNMCPNYPSEISMLSNLMPDEPPKKKRKY